LRRTLVLLARVAAMKKSTAMLFLNHLFISAYSLNSSFCLPE